MKHTILEWCIENQFSDEVKRAYRQMARCALNLGHIIAVPL
ncbi:hypothetical protein [Sphingobium yanoikuyae]